MGVAMYTVLGDGLDRLNGQIKKCEDWHNEQTCIDARKNDENARAMISNMVASGSLTSTDRFFSIKIIAVNRQPSFNILPQIHVLADSWAWAGQVASNITTDRTVDNT